tara:strand:+ start:12 stop:1154 length:1143 start_codon:yes stop_codon:yes gene_type:complete
MSDNSILSDDKKRQLTLELGERSYDIMVGQKLLEQAGSLISSLIPSNKVIIVSDSNIAPLYLAKLENSLKNAGIKFSSVTLKPGEKIKSFEHLQNLIEILLEKGVDRKTTLIALGGGVIGDLTGFCAAIIMRGIHYIQIPTTLLSQVDSSVGGKTGINSTFGKNLIGAFHQPLLVLIDLNCLDSLPHRQLMAGYAEIIKYSLINDAEFFSWLEVNGSSLIKGNKDLQAQAILKSCAVKAKIVAEDERESGIRALLNLGHTFAHALEAEVGYSDKLLHGEAVSIGMMMAFELSQQLGFCHETDVERVRAHLNKIGLPASLAGIANDKWTPKRLINHMALDKKTEGGSMTFILAHAIGLSFIFRDIDPKKLDTFLANALNTA